MKLAVVMAVHNNQSTLQTAIKSILNQSFQDFKFIIIDDASTDGSATILTKFALDDKRVQIITNNHHLGLTRSLNIGLKRTKAQYIARMDADDISLPKRLETQIQFLNKHPQIMLLGTAVYLINDQEKQLSLKRFPSDYQTLRHQVLKHCPFIHPTWIIRRSILTKIGSYNQKFPFAQDYEFVLKLLAKHQAANLPQPLLKYRVDSTHAISFNNLKQQEFLALKARFLAITKYGYPKTESWKLIKPLLSFLVPTFIKIPIYKKLYWQFK